MGTEGVKTAYRRGKDGVQKRLRWGTEGVKTGYRRGKDGVQKGVQRGYRWR